MKKLLQSIQNRWAIHLGHQNNLGLNNLLDVRYSISKMLKLFYGALHLELLHEVSFKTPFIRLKRCKSRFENAEMQMNLNWIKWIPGGISPAPAPWKCEGFIPCLPPTQMNNIFQTRHKKGIQKMTSKWRYMEIKAVGSLWRKEVCQEFLLFT